MPISLITAQNEPEYSPSNYPGSTLTASPGGQLHRRQPRAGPAEGRAQHQDHRLRPQLERPSFPETVLGDSTAGPYTAGVAWHCYAGDPSAQTTVARRLPVLRTPTSPNVPARQSSNPANTFSDSLDWQTENLIIDATRNWAKTVTTWNMALDPSGGPSMNCTTCTAR